MDPNPLLEECVLPRFHAIRAEHVEPAVRQRIDEAKRLAEDLLAVPGEPTWETFVVPLDEADERVERASRPVDHLAHVLEDKSLRDANQVVRPIVAEFGS